MTADKDKGTQKKETARDGRSAGFDPRAHMRQLKGQDYLEARWRVVWFREDNPDGQIDTTIIYHDREKKEIMFRATVTVPASGASASGYCEGSERDFKFGYVEKAETQAVGRALAFLGYGTAQAAELDITDGDKPADTPVATKQPSGTARANTRPASAPSQQQATRNPEPTLVKAAREMAAETGRADGQPTTRSVEQAKADLKEACLRIGLRAPLSLREVNTLAGQYGVDMVGSSAGVTAAWLERIRAALPDIPVGPLDREHMTEQATVLEALRATCQALRRPEPQSLDELNALAAQVGMGLVASWDSVTAGWLEAIRRGVGAAPPTGGPSGTSTHPHAVDRTEQALAGWIAAAPDGATLEDLATDVAEAHEAGTLTDAAATALLMAVDARGAELDLYGPTELDLDGPAEEAPPAERMEAEATSGVSEREAQRREAVAHAAG